MPLFSYMILLWNRVTHTTYCHVLGWCISNTVECCYNVFQNIENNVYVLEWQTIYMLTRGLFWCLFPELRSNEGDKHRNNTRVSAQTVCHKTTYIILFLTRHNKPINDDKNDNLHTPSPWLTCSVYVLLMTSQSSADDVKMTRQLWWDHTKSDI